MTRPLAMTMLATLLAGCQSPTAAIDPFFGRQAVAPPNSVLATGAPATNNNYYQPPPTTVGASLPPAPATAANGPGGAFAPPGGNFGFSGTNSTATNRLGSRPATTPASTPQSNSGSGSSLAPRGTINNPPMYQTNPGERSPSASGAGASNSSTSSPFQANSAPSSGGFRPATLASRPNEPATSNVGNTFNSRSSLPSTTTPANGGASTTNNGFYTPPRLRTQAPASPPTDIMNLPDRNAPLRRPVGTGSGSFNTPSGSGLGGAGASNYDADGEQPGGFQPPNNIRRASFTEPAGSTSSSKRTSRVGSLSGVGARGDYGKDANYGWLRGKLEYSKTEDRWKLRYIPIDGETDDYGGSVTLLGSRELQGFEAGDFVTAYGTLGETSAGGRDFAAAYRLDRVVRQSE